eukprot:IDg13081t1
MTIEGNPQTKSTVPPAAAFWQWCRHRLESYALCVRGVRATMGLIRAARVLALFLSCSLLFVSDAAENGGFDHRSHSVPGADKVVYDVDD